MTFGGALEFLRDHGVDLRALDELLRAAGDDGLHVRVARARLREWSARNDRAAAAVLATRLDGDTAKSTIWLGDRQPNLDTSSTRRRMKGWLRSWIR
jgi:hypothetical protein